MQISFSPVSGYENGMEGIAAGILGSNWRIVNVAFGLGEAKKMEETEETKDEL